MLRHLTLLSVLALLLSSCVEPAEPVGLLKPVVYDLGQVLEGQVKLLSTAGAGVTKVASRPGQPTETARSQRTDWRKELEIFQQASISRPAWRREFSADTVAEAGGKTIVYRRLPGSKASVEYLKVKLDAQGKPLRTEAATGSSNFLYSTQKLLVLSFGRHDGQPVLKEYLVQGSQKMVMADSLRFRLHGLVQL